MRPELASGALPIELDLHLLGLERVSLMRGTNKRLMTVVFGQIEN